MIPRASPLWQLVHCAWSSCLAHYETKHRKTHGPLREDAIAAVEAFYRCGDLTTGFTRFHCPECGYEHLLAHTCKTRFCPSCNQRRVQQGARWIAHAVCVRVPHRHCVFTMPRMLRGIFRKRRHLLDHLFSVALACLRDWMRARLGIPKGQLAAIAAVHTFGDFLTFHPHLHILIANGLFDPEGRFHLLPDQETAQPLAELFRARFLNTLVKNKLLSERKARDLLGWKHSGFTVDLTSKPVPAHAKEGRRQVAEYLLRALFSLQKIIWKPETQTVIYRSEENWRTKRNFEVFSAEDFLAAAVSHIPPMGQQQVRYYGAYSNKSRGINHQAGRHLPVEDTPPEVLPAPRKASARQLRPLWRDLILETWGEDPMLCPRCGTIMRHADKLIRPEEVEKRRRLVGVLDRNPRSG